MAQIMPSGSVSENEYWSAFDDFCIFDEDQSDNRDIDNLGNLIELPDTLQLVEEGIASSVFSCSLDQLDDLRDANAEGEDNIGEIFEIPIISHDMAI